ncbi:MAG: hypothetical protein J5676_04440 [Bacteroidaceae bacterium]|nr:hypothetical protein [Bacteroidaceae bacterium]
MKKTVFVLLSMIIVALSIPLLPFFLFVFMYSHGNEIDFDVKSATVTHKEGRELYRLYLDGDSLEDIYHIELKEGHEAAKKISLTSVDTNYIITDWHDNLFTKIPFSPNRKYRIENHSNGDCGPGTVAFMTDSLGKPACIMPYE